MQTYEPPTLDKPWWTARQVASALVQNSGTLSYQQGMQRALRTLGRYGYVRLENAVITIAAGMQEKMIARFLE